MKKKILGVLVFMLLIATVFVPVSMGMDVFTDTDKIAVSAFFDLNKEKNVFEEIDKTEGKNLLIDKIIGALPKESLRSKLNQYT